MNQFMSEEEKEYRREIAKTIYQQMGGNLFALVTGARNFTALMEPPIGGLSFTLPGDPALIKDGINYVKIVLNGLDYYDVYFERKEGDTYRPICSHNDVDCEQLQTIFEDVTGLLTHP